MKTDTKQISVRFPEHIYNRILDKAKAERRSFNAEINKIVEENIQKEREPQK